MTHGEKILNALQGGEWVNGTTLQKLSPRFTTRISDLRRSGHNIESRVSGIRKGVQTYQYRLTTGEPSLTTYARIPLDREQLVTFAKTIARNEYGTLSGSAPRAFLNSVKNLTDTQIRDGLRNEAVLAGAYAHLAALLLSEFDSAE